MPSHSWHCPIVWSQFFKNKYKDLYNNNKKTLAYVVFIKKMFYWYFELYLLKKKNKLYDQVNQQNKVGC